MQSDDSLSIGCVENDNIVEGDTSACNEEPARDTQPAPAEIIMTKSDTSDAYREADSPISSSEEEVGIFWMIKFLIDHL